MPEWLTDFYHYIRDPSALIKAAGTWFQAGAYVVMALIVFTETGLLIGFFLPGDSLLVVAGVFCGGEEPILNLFLVNLILIPAAIIGDAVGFMIGRKAGPALYDRPDSRFFKKKHLIAAREFYDRHGGKTIILARFIPIVRTFAPVVAGMADMEYRRFAFFNITGGILWVTSLTLVGFFLGRVFPEIIKRIDLLAVTIIAISLLPIVIEWWRHRRSAGTAGERHELTPDGKPAPSPGASSDGTTPSTTAAPVPGDVPRV